MYACVHVCKHANSELRGIKGLPPRSQLGRIEAAVNAALMYVYVYVHVYVHLCMYLHDRSWGE